MTYHPIFLSIVLVVKNQSSALQTLATQATNLIKPIVSDYELIIVDNSSTDESIDTLKKLCGPAGIPNLQIYALTKEVSLDTAFWVGIRVGKPTIGHSRHNAPTRTFDPLREMQP